MICCIVEAVYLTAQSVRDDETCETEIPRCLAMLTILQMWQH